MQSQLIKSTTSRCPICFARCPAEVWRRGESPSQIFLDRECPQHGMFSQCVSSDARFYWYSKGADKSCGCETGACSAQDGTLVGAIGRNAMLPKGSVFEKLSTCIALIEIVNSCNLSCPTCYADSPLGIGKKVDAIPLEDLKRRIGGVIDRKGGIEILQLSGGEPTLHPKFFELLDWIVTNGGIDYVLLNTNGVKIARDAEFASELQKRLKPGHIQAYLQFDGIQEEAQTFLRGSDLRELKKDAILKSQEIGLPITLAMTVVPENLHALWAAIQFGLSFSHVRGITFQPAFFSGRGPAQLKAPARLSTADIIVNAVEQSDGMLKFEDFTPLPCGDPNCATIGYLLKTESGVKSISDFVDFKKIQGFLQDRIRYKLEDLIHCGCEAEPLGALLKEFEMDASHTFRLFIKPFMDAWTWDEDRIDRCCTHVIRPDGKLDSFCRYYSGFSDTVC